jgi:hypothetical protein
MGRGFGSAHMLFKGRFMNYNTLAQLVSAPRMETYLAKAGGDTDTAYKLYCWNLDISSALFDIIGIIEVALRNSIDKALIEYNSGNSWIIEPNI